MARLPTLDAFQYVKKQRNWHTNTENVEQMLTEKEVANSIDDDLACELVNSCPVLAKN